MTSPQEFIALGRAVIDAAKALNEAAARATEAGWRLQYDNQEPGDDPCRLDRLALEAPYEALSALCGDAGAAEDTDPAADEPRSAPARLDRAALAARRAECLRIIATNERPNTPMIAARMGISSDALRSNLLRELRRNGLIETVGAKRSAYYQLTDAGRDVLARGESAGEPNAVRTKSAGAALPPGVKRRCQTCGDVFEPCDAADIHCNACDATGPGEPEDDWRAGRAA